MEKEKGLIAVLGGGESGLGAALLAKRKGFSVFLSDKGKIKQENKALLEKAGIPFEEGRHTPERIFSAREVIKSPGIPDHIPLIRDLTEKGIPVISEIEFAGRFTNAFLVGITGSNGKTTTTRLIYHLLKAGGKNAAMAGNVGMSFARSLAEEEEKELYVLELSSFQLDGIRDFRAGIAMILNISPDHLDRYDNKMEKYVAAKFRIQENQKTGDFFLYNADDERIVASLKQKEPKAQTIPIEKSMVEFEKVTVEEHTYRVNNIALKGPHNLMNAAFAIQTAHLLKVGPAAVQRGLDTFVNVPHRLEWVRETEGVDFYNDSKATNVDAVFYALQAINRPIIWIAGGQDKGNDYAPLFPLVREKVRALVCMGADNRKLKEAFGGLSIPVQETDSAEAAGRAAFRQAQRGDVVLLSPACASFDLFNNYEDRGDQFKAAVQALKEKN